MSSVEDVINMWKTMSEEEKEKIRESLQGPEVERLVDIRIESMVINLSIKGGE